MHTLTRLLQGICLLPTTALFIGLLTCRLQLSCRGLAWPLLVEPDTHIAIELILACLPAFTLFLLIAVGGLRRRARPVATPLIFTLCAPLAAACALGLLASAYGATWTTSEIIHELLLSQLDLLGLALLPGLMTVVLLERLNRQCS